MQREAIKKSVLKLRFMLVGAEFELATGLLSFLITTTTFEVLVVFEAVLVRLLVMTMVVAQGVAYTVTVPVGQSGHTGTHVVAIGTTPQVGMIAGMQ